MATQDSKPQHVQHFKDFCSNMAFRGLKKTESIHSFQPMMIAALGPRRLKVPGFGKKCVRSVGEALYSLFQIDDVGEWCRGDFKGDSAFTNKIRYELNRLFESREIESIITNSLASNLKKVIREELEKTEEYISSETRLQVLANETVQDLVHQEALKIASEQLFAVMVPSRFKSKQKCKSYYENLIDEMLVKNNRSAKATIRMLLGLFAAAIQKELVIIKITRDSIHGPRKDMSDFSTDNNGIKLFCCDYTKSPIEPLTIHINVA